MPSLTDLQISLFNEEDVDYLLQCMPNLQKLNNLTVDESNRSLVTHS